MKDSPKNIIIGLFVLAAGLVVLWFLLFLHPHLGDEGQVIYVRFADIDKVSVGTRVTFAGKPVGEVAAIREIEKGRQGPKRDEDIEDDYVYIYELKLLIDSSVRLYNTDIFTLRTSGLLGDRSVAILPEPPKPGETLHLIRKNDIVYAQPTSSVEDAMEKFKVISTKIDLALEQVTEILQNLNDEKFVQKISDAAGNIRDITAALNKPEELAGIIDNLHRLSQRVIDSWDIVDESLRNFETASENTRSMTQNADEIVEKVRKGEGTIGKLVMGDDLYLRLTSLLSKGEVVFDDVNHYGLLFHLDKGWQRTRARQMNLLQKLSTPQQFRNYFNDEVDQISTSLSRVSMVLDKTEFDPEYPLVNNREFKKVFAELLRRVQGVEDSLKMYNQQLIEPEVYKTELCQ
jgi:phospholipid/cholesterol/gamma-HCH transport system substrate-binding protein